MVPHPVLSSNVTGGHASPLLPSEKLHNPREGEDLKDAELRDFGQALKAPPYIGKLDILGRGYVAWEDEAELGSYVSNHGDHGDAPMLDFRDSAALEGRRVLSPAFVVSSSWQSSSSSTCRSREIKKQRKKRMAANIE